MLTSQTSTLTAGSVLMRARDAARWAKVSKSTWYAWAARGRIPAGIALSKGVVVWDMAAVAAKLAEPAKPEAR